MILSKLKKELQFTIDPQVWNHSFPTEPDSAYNIHQHGYRDVALILGIAALLASCVLLACFIRQARPPQNRRTPHKPFKLDSKSISLNSTRSNQILGLKKNSAYGSSLNRRKKSNSIECILCNKKSQVIDLVQEPNEASSNTHSNLYEIKCVRSEQKPSAPPNSRLRTHFLIKFHPFTLTLPDKAGLIKNLERSSSVARKHERKMSQRCCLSVSVVPFDKQSSKHNKNKSKAKTNNSSIQITKQAESEDTGDDAPYTKDTHKLIELPKQPEAQPLHSVAAMHKASNLNELINSSMGSSAHGITHEHAAEANFIDYVNTIHTPSSSCSANSLCKIEAAQQRFSVVSLSSTASSAHSKKLAPSEFCMRINQLKFIDESGSSTAVSSPMGSTSHLYWPKRQPQHQHNLLSSSTSSSRTVSLAPSSSSGQSTPKQQAKQKRTPSMQRQSNVQSSTETLCSDTSQLQRQHELLGPNYLREVKGKNSSEHDDDELLGIIARTNSEDVAPGRPVIINSMKNFEDSYSEDDSYYSHLYAENKKLLEKTKMEKIQLKQNKVNNNDSDSSSVCSASNAKCKKNYRTCNKYGKQFYPFPSVRNSLATQSDERIYAYDNFDCINECVEEHDHLNDNDDDEETSNLVEDGFIRMSSPVDSGLNNSNNNTNLDSTGLDSTTDLNDIEISSIGFANVTNFPNVGSSPISDEFLNTSSDADVETFVENIKSNTDFDGIIIHNSSDSNANEITSLSDENAELNEEQDDFGFEGFDKSQIKYLNTHPKTPLSIMKTKSSCLKNNEHGMNEASSNSECAELANSSVQANSSQKPKVRFNLDIDYEKEREWNRINKIIGDASKTQIEWTQEVEV